VTDLSGPSPCLVRLPEYGFGLKKVLTCSVGETLGATGRPLVGDDAWTAVGVSRARIEVAAMPAPWTCSSGSTRLAAVSVTPGTFRASAYGLHEVPSHLPTDRRWFWNSQEA